MVTSYLLAETIMTALIGKFGLGANPLRSMLLAVIVMGVLGAVFTLREWAWLYIAGIWLYLVLIPVVEAAEQTVIQQVVPLQRQGRVFGFAMAFESAAAPITAFLIAPIAQVWIIPYARSAEGAAQLAPLLGGFAAEQGHLGFTRVVMVVAVGVWAATVGLYFLGVLLESAIGTARFLGVNNIFDARENVFGGTRYLRTLLDTFNGDLDLALAAYNAGPGAVQKYRGVPPYRETTQYVVRVLARYDGASGVSPAPSNQ